MYLLDANIHFGLVTETVRMLEFGQEIPEIIVVGIGYLDDSQHLSLRSRDYTPCPNDLGIRNWLKRISTNSKIPIVFRGTGIAEEFLTFLRQELKPYLQKNYRIDPYDNALAGVSFGALENFEPESAAMVTNLKISVENLKSRNYPLLKLTSHIFEDETHLSVIPATMSRGLRAVFK